MMSTVVDHSKVFYLIREFVLDHVLLNDHGSYLLESSLFVYIYVPQLYRYTSNNTHNKIIHVVNNIIVQEFIPA